MPPAPAATERTPLAAAAAGPSAGTFERGLSSAEAKRRLLKNGPNELEAAGKESLLQILLTQMRNMIFLLAGIAATLCHLVGDNVKCGVLVFLISSVIIANTIGEYSAQDAAAALARMASPKARVLRDGAEVEIETRELVVGDVVNIRAGDVVPADMLVVESVDIQTNEAALTGESTEQRKTVELLHNSATFPSNMLYSATSVVAGKGLGQVMATGMQTQVGLIAKRLNHEDRSLQMNPLQISINLLGTCIGCACIAIAILAGTTSYLLEYQNPNDPCADDDDRCMLVSSILRGLLLAISIIPAGLPMIVAIMLRVGSTEMAKRNAVVTRQSTVDYLGATTVICTDKTGTLTEGKMTAEAVVGLVHAGREGSTSESSLAFYPLRGAHPNGGLFTAASLTQEAKSRINADFDSRQRRQVFSGSGILDLAEPEEAAKPGPTQDALLARASLACAFLNCYESKLIEKSEGVWTTSGSMTEAALKVAAAKGRLLDGEGRGAELLQTYKRDSDMEVPFTPKRKMMATVHELPSDRRFETFQFPADASHFAIVKGAPDLLLPKVSVAAKVEDSGVLAVPGGRLSDEERDALLLRNMELSRRALRSILIAVRPLTRGEAAGLKGADADTRLLSMLEPTGFGLCFVCLWGIYDPPRAMVPRSVEECHRAGIRVVMITGDQRPTAIAIAKQVHILAEQDDPEFCSAVCTDLQEPGGSQVQARGAHGARKEVDSHELEFKSSSTIAEMTSRINVWSRAHPTDKVAIVDSLSNQCHITAMTGDGVNDAPALKRAMVGVSMGIAGTEVAKNSSELILMDDDFSTIVAAVREGRKIYMNVQKYVTFNLSIKAGECTCLMTSIIAGTPMPIHGLQLLLNLICTHIIPTMSLAWEEAESYVMRVPPRNTKRDIVIPPVMWLFKWLPFVLCMPCTVLSCLRLGVWAHTGFVYGKSLIGSSQVDALEMGLAACEYAGALNFGGQFIEDTEPFHCRCHVHPGGLPWAAPEQVDQWGRTASRAELDGSFDRWTGGTGDLFKKGRTPWRNGTEGLLKPCEDGQQVMRWCWRDPSIAKEERPLLPRGRNCAGYGAQLGQSMAYTSIHLGEILSLCTYRMNGFFLPRALSNSVYSGFFLFNFTMLMIFLYVPPVTKILQLTPLSASRFCLAACFALCLTMLNEFFKIFYRMRLETLNAQLEEDALVLARGGAGKSGSNV